jgi:phosphate transport system protein
MQDENDNMDEMNNNTLEEIQFVQEEAVEPAHAVEPSVDELKEQVFRELLTYMISDPATIKRALDLILISRNLERIADHATNIAEDVVFVVAGKDIRHHAEQSVTP